MKISFICTVYNEAGSINRLLSSVSRQTIAPSEFVICDAGSTDDTVERIQKWAEKQPFKVVVIVKKSASISRGRNVAIEHATYPIIAVTDGGCELHPEWLAEITAPFRAPNIGVSYGRTRAFGDTRVGKAFAGFYNNKTNIDDAGGTELSSRSVAFTKTACEQVGGYPEWLTLAGEDTLFFLDINKITDVAQAPKAICHWWHGQETLKKIARIHIRNAIGCGEARMFALQHIIITGICVYALAILPLLFFRPLIGLLLLASYIAYNARASVKTVAVTGFVDSFIVLPVVLCVRDFGTAIGFWRGLIFGKRP